MENAINRMADWHRSVHINDTPRPSGIELLDEGTFGLESEVQELREEALLARKAQRKDGRLPLGMVRNIKDEIVDVMLRCVGAFEAASEMEPGKPITLTEAIQDKVNHTVEKKYPVDRINELRGQGLTKEEALATLKLEHNQKKAETNGNGNHINGNGELPEAPAEDVLPFERIKQLKSQGLTTEQAIKTIKEEQTKRALAVKQTDTIKEAPVKANEAKPSAFKRPAVKKAA